MKISYNEACSMNCSTLEQDLILCEEAGFDYIEIRLDKLSEYLQNHTLQDLRSFFDVSNLKPATINAIYLYDAFLSEKDDSNKSEELLEKFMFTVFAAKEIGATGIIIVPPILKDHPHLLPEEESTENCCRILRRFGTLAAPYGIRLAFELVGLQRAAVRSVSHAKKIVEKTNMDNVGYCMDSYNIYLNGRVNDFSELQSIPADKLFAVHINSGDGVDLNTQAERCFVDRGILNIGQFLDQLNETGYDGMVSIEVFRPEYWEKPAEWVVRNAYRTTAALMKNRGCL